MYITGPDQSANIRSLIRVCCMSIKSAISSSFVFLLFFFFFFFFCCCFFGFFFLVFNQIHGTLINAKTEVPLVFIKVIDILIFNIIS